MGSAAWDEGGRGVPPHTHLPAPTGWPSLEGRAGAVLGQDFRSRDSSEKDLGLARRRGAGFSYPTEVAELPQAKPGSAGAPRPGRGQCGSPAHPSAEAAPLGPSCPLQLQAGVRKPVRGRESQAPAALPHRLAGLGRGEGRGGRRGADVAARPAAGEAGRRLPARLSPASSCGGPVAAAAAVALGAGS